MCHIRVLSITKSLYDALSQNYSCEGTFIPTNLRKGCFVIFVKDNIDKNASANLIISHYHGTSNLYCNSQLMASWVMNPIE